MIFKNIKIQKFIAALMIVAALSPAMTVFVTPKKAEAQFTDFANLALNGIKLVYGVASAAASSTSAFFDSHQALKQITQEVLKSIAKRLLAEMTKSTVNWINTGFHGQPLFLENPNSFFRDIAKSEIKDLVEVTGYDSFRFPFGKQFALDVISSYKNQFAQNASYSLSRATQDADYAYRFRTDFNVGGWNGFLINTQFPQNNLIGYQMMATEELSRKLAGTSQSAANKVKETLQQGMGFLSPQTCPSNPNYNNGRNEFNKPSFQSKIVYDFKPTVANMGDTAAAYEAEKKKYDDEYNKKIAAEKAAWEDPKGPNVCPGGLVNTTPGSVAGNQIMRAMSSSFSQTELGAAMGNSLSAIFDALLNKFMQDGLNSLASKVNPQVQDDFSYMGQTLGSPSGAINGYTDPFAGPDEEIVLSKFKEEVTQGIANTTLELRLMSNTDPLNPGLIQIEDKIWQAAQRLDVCIPGPDKNWEKRLDAERDRIINNKLMPETGSKDYLKSRDATGAVRDLRFAVASFKDWLMTKIIGELPDAILYTDEVNSLNVNAQDQTRLTESNRTKGAALARLQAISRSLAAITTQPEPGSAAEKNLIAIKKQYNAVQTTVSNTGTVEDTRNLLNSAKDKLENLGKMLTTCETQRTAAGWSNPGGPNSTNSKAGGKTEAQLFCSVPIISGYSHGDLIRSDDANGHLAGKFRFRNPAFEVFGEDPQDGQWNVRDLTSEKSSPGYEELPMVNANRIYGDVTNNFQPVNVDIDCKVVYKATDIDYKHAGEETF